MMSPRRPSSNPNVQARLMNSNISSPRGPLASHLEYSDDVFTEEWSKTQRAEADQNANDEEEDLQASLGDAVEFVVRLQRQEIVTQNMNTRASAVEVHRTGGLGIGLQVTSLNAHRHSQAEPESTYEHPEYSLSLSFSLSLYF